MGFHRHIIHFQTQVLVVCIVLGVGIVSVPVVGIVPAPAPAPAPVLVPASVDFEILLVAASRLVHIHFLVVPELNQIDLLSSLVPHDSVLRYTNFAIGTIHNQIPNYKDVFSARTVNNLRYDNR